MGARVKGRGERTIGAYTALQVCDLSQRGVLSACAQQVAQGATVNAPVAALVEELESFAVVGGGLVVVIHCVCGNSLLSLCGYVYFGRSWEERAPCLVGCCVTESCCAATLVKESCAKGSVVPCFVDRQRQPRAANHRARSAALSSLFPFW